MCSKCQEGRLLAECIARKHGRLAQNLHDWMTAVIILNRDGVRGLRGKPSLSQRFRRYGLQRIPSERFSFEGLRARKLIYILMEIVKWFLNPEMTPTQLGKELRVVSLRPYH
jgi:hypothetical protein